MIRVTAYPSHTPNDAHAARHLVMLERDTFNHLRAAADHPISQPRVSVVTMTFNRPDALGRCLESLVSQTLPAEQFEVVVVDASTPTVESVLARFQHRLRLVHAVVMNHGVAANRNAGAARASGAVLAFLDDDCRAASTWLTELLAAVEQHPRTIAAAAVVHEAPITAVAAAGQVITDAVHAFFNPPGAPPRFLPGLNFAIEREAYLALGGCDHHYGRLAAEDRDFMDRWGASGGSLVYCPSTVVHHDHRSTFRGFVRQYINYGRGAWRYHQGRRARRSGTMRDDVALHLQLPRYLRHSLARLPRSQRVPTILLLVVWQVANAIGFVYQAMVDAVRRAPTVAAPASRIG